MSGFLADEGMKFHYMYSKTLTVMKFFHVHPQYELYFCADNVAQRSIINGVEYYCKYPCVILSAPFTIHSMSCDDNNAESYERYVFNFGDRILRTLEHHLPTDVLAPNVGLLFKLSEEQARYLKAYIDMCDFQNVSDTENELMLAFVLNKLFDICSPEDIIKFGTSSFYMQDVLQYISENFNSETADGVAEHFSVSRSKLDRDFKHFTGLTVHRFVELCRLNHAKSRLSEKNEYSIDQISEECGFSSTTHFFPFFKKHTGKTPMEFRNESRNKPPRSGIK